MRRWLTSSELRLALRLIAKQPVLSITIVFALATGICLATIGFTLREAMLNSSLPFANGDRFVRLVMHSEADDNVELDLDRYHAIRDTSTSFMHLGAVGGVEYALESEDGTIEPISVNLITPKSFAVLPAAPIIGRALSAADGQPGAESVAVLRESLWRRRFAASASIVGQPIQLSGMQRTVIGVLPDSFKFPSSGEIWVPLDEATLAGRATGANASLTVFGILRDALNRDGATAELSAYSRPERNGRPGTATSIRALPFTGDDDSTNIVMSGLVGVLVLVLLVVASNIASLVFARTWSRSQELAVRTAIGADRARIVGQLFLEVVLLCAVAAALGLGGAQIALTYLKAAITEIPFWMTFDPTVRTMLFVVALTFGVSVVSGLAPALKATKASLTGALHRQGRGFARGDIGTVGRVLVIEIALAVALLNAALVTARALNSYVDDIPALPKGEVLTARVNSELSKDTRERVLTAIRAIPGIVSAGAASHLPRLDPMPRPIVIESIDGRTPSAIESTPVAEVSDGFLETIGGRAVAGRLFTAGDFARGAAAVVLVNQPFVNRFYNGQSPLGRHLTLTAPDSVVSPSHEIIGVVPDLGMSAGNRAAAAGIYIPLSDRTEGLQLAIRSAGNPNTAAGPLRKVMAEIDPGADLRGIRRLEDVGVEQRAFLSGMASAMTALGVMALLLAVVSIYTLLSFMVTGRTREIGIRVALGARTSQVLTIVAGNTFMLLGIGAVAGTILGVWIAGFQSVMLIRMPTAGVTTPAIVLSALLLASLGGAWLPARRALSIKPVEALGAE